jgi:hypothetical protein
MKLASILFFLAGIVAVGYFFYDQYYNLDEPYKILVEIPEFENNHPDRIKTIELIDFFKAEKEFDDLAEEGFYTVVLVRSIDCSGCMVMEEHFSALLDERPDIRIYKINIPSRHIQFYRGSDQQEYEKNLAASNTHYGIKELPLVIIFQPNTKKYVNSQHGSKAAEILLNKWIERTL